jgi:hypothetical protein
MPEVALDAHLSEFKAQGFTIFPAFISRDRVAALRAILDPLFDSLFADASLGSVNSRLPRRKIHPLLGHEVLGPELRDFALNPLMLDFAEMVMGPFVQGDRFEVSGFPARDATLRGEPELWHRDHFHVAGMYADVNPSSARKPYTPPMGCNCLTYLQDMDAATGPFAMIPGSHLDFTVIEESQSREPHPRQQTLTLQAGDMVFLHHDVLHTGTANTSTQTRYFISNYLCHFGFPHRDTFDLPLVRDILAEATARNDRRTLRFFGDDPGLLQRQEQTWRSLIEADRHALRA